MKIEWTDAAVRAAVRAHQGTIGSDHLVMHAALDAAWAEQTRPETDAEKVKRYEAALIRLRVRSVPDSEFDRIITEALSYRKET